MFERVHHVAYTVESLEEYRTFFEEALQFPLVARREMPDAGYDADVYEVGETLIEVQEPRGHEEMERFLSEHGEGLNHVAYEVDDIEDAVEILESYGMEPQWEEPMVAPTFPDYALLDMDVETTKGIYLQLVEKLGESSDA
ncbi:MAG: VOC family protein [Halodesulfurarchaeum sp.]